MKAIWMISNVKSKKLKVSIHILFLLFTFYLLFSTGCARQMLVPGYYLLEYRPAMDNPGLKLLEPLPYRVQVSSLKIPRSYDSIRIIARFSTHQINYYRYSLWAVRPQVAIADLLAQHINAYRLFRDCQREYLEERPDYEISGEILQIERFESERYCAAHLKMTLDFYDYDSNDLLVSHSFDREMPIPAGSMTIFAKALSDILDDEAENFLVKVVKYFQPAEEDTVQAEK